MEIARITIASVTQDATSVYARRGKNRIYYRVVDEYEGRTLSERRTRTSKRPLTLGELETFFNGAWSLLYVLDVNCFRNGSLPRPHQGNPREPWPTSRQCGASRGRMIRSTGVD